MAPMTASARKNSIRQRSHAGRRVAGLCVGADDCQYTKKLSNAAQPCGAARGRQ